MILIQWDLLPVGPSDRALMPAKTAKTELASHHYKLSQSITDGHSVVEHISSLMGLIKVIFFLLSATLRNTLSRTRRMHTWILVSFEPCAGIEIVLSELLC